MNEPINLPFWESLKRTYLYAFINFGKILKIGLFWVVLIVLADWAMSFPSQCQAGQKCLGWQSNLSMLLATIAAAAVSVAFSREIILKEKRNWLQISFGRREIKYLFYNLLILLMIILAAAVLGVFYSLIMQLTGGVNSAGQLEQPMTLLIYLAAVLAVAVVVSRFCLVLPAVAVDNQKFSFATAFEVSKGNSNKIFLGLFLSSLPVLVALLAVSAFLQAAPIENWLAKLLISFVLVTLTMLNAILKACYLAHIYQYFIYFYNQRTAEVTAERSKLD